MFLVDFYLQSFFLPTFSSHINFVVPSQALSSSTYLLLFPSILCFSAIHFCFVLLKNKKLFFKSNSRQSSAKALSSSQVSILCHVKIFTIRQLRASSQLNAHPRDVNLFISKKEFSEAGDYPKLKQPK
jgi:hypothetical protein